MENKDKDKNEDKEFNDKIAQISKMNHIFKKISDKYKNASDKYLFKQTLIEFLNNIIRDNLIIKDEIEAGTFFFFDYPFFIVKKEKEFLFNIEFLVECKFKDDKNKTFSFWVCSFDYLKEKLLYLGYKEAKINKKKLFSEFEEQKDIKPNYSSSSESIDDRNEIDTELINYEVIVSKSPFNLQNIFKKSQNIFDPSDNNNNNNNIEEYKKDLNIPKSIDVSNVKFNSNYFTILTDIFKNKKNIYYYFYNEKSGLSLSLLQILEKRKKIFDFRYFYFTAELVEKYKKKYFYFRIAKIFKSDEEKKFIDQINSNEKEDLNYNSEYIVKTLNKIFKDNKDFENIYIVFDNIRNKIILEKIQNIVNAINYSNNITIFLFIAINPSILNLINNIKSNTSKIISLFPQDNSSKQELPPKEYFDSLVLKNKDNFLEIYKKNIKNIISSLNDNSIEFLIFLTKLLHNKLFIEKNSLTSYNENNYLNYLLPYLYISISAENSVTLIDKIQFRTNFIKENIIDQFNLLLSRYMVIDDIFHKIKTKSTEGIYIEKEIIYYLITKMINLNKITIEKIYCFDSKLNKNFISPEIILIQELESAPLYDFGIIKYFDGELVFKGYQIGINKPYKSLLHLLKEIIKMDMLYFISKINKFLSQKITKFTFGIITTIYAYKSQNKKNKHTEINNDDKNNDNNDDDNNDDKNNDNNDNNKDNNDYKNIDNNDDNNNDDDNNDKNNDDYIKDDKKEEKNDNEYKNYEIMKNHCKENNFEFLIFDPKDNNFYIDKETNLEKIVFNNYYNKQFENNIDNFIFKNEEHYNLIKLPLNPNEIVKTDKEYIEKLVIDIKDKQLNFVGKFKIEGKNKDEIDFNSLINNNFLIYAKDKKKNKTIFYKNNYSCKDCKNFDTFYIFDTSLTKSKRGRKIKDNSLEDKNKVALDTENLKIEGKNDDNAFLSRKRKNQKKKISK